MRTNKVLDRALELGIGLMVIATIVAGIRAPMATEILIGQTLMIQATTSPTTAPTTSQYNLAMVKHKGAAGEFARLNRSPAVVGKVVVE
jgi:hypothetical protein